MTELSDYAGRLAVVTGAGDGIGEMLARGLAQLGMVVAVQDIRADAAERVASEIGGGAFPLVFDVSDREACLAGAEQLRAVGHPLSVLWINAGVGVGSPVLNGRPNAIEWGFSVNVLGVIWTAQAFAPLLRDAGGARHVGVTASSAAMAAPAGDFPLYALTKHGTFAVAETLRDEFGADGIPLTVFCPGLLNTKIWDGAKARPERFGGARHMDPAISRRWDEAKTPDVMWPAIEGALAGPGGYLICGTEGGLKDVWQSRAKAIADAIIDV